MFFGKLFVSNKLLVTVQINCLTAYIRYKQDVSTKESKIKLNIISVLGTMTARH